MSLKKVLTAASALVVLSPAAVAQTPNRLEQFNDWGTYSYTAGGNKVCYVLSTPKTKEPASVNHGDIFFLVSQKPGQATAYEPQVVMGYPMREGSKVTVTVDARKFTLFTRAEVASTDMERPLRIAATSCGSSDGFSTQADSPRVNRVNLRASTVTVTLEPSRMG